MDDPTAPTDGGILRRAVRSVAAHPVITVVLGVLAVVAIVLSALIGLPVVVTVVLLAVVGVGAVASGTSRMVDEAELPPPYFTRFGLHPEAKLTDAEMAELIDGLRRTPGLAGDRGRIAGGAQASGHTTRVRQVLGSGSEPGSLR